MARRFQKEAPCKLGCSPTALDCIEHYCQCPVVSDLLGKWGLIVEASPLENFFCLSHGMSEHELTLRAIAVYAVFRATSFYRDKPTPLRSTIADALEQWGKGAVSNHPKSSEVFTQACRQFFI